MVCVDLKMVNFLLGQQSGYTKSPCFPCLWYSRAKDQHYVKKDWPLRTKLKPGVKNVVVISLVSNALDKEGKCFEYFRNLFSGISRAKEKMGILDGLDFGKLVRIFISSNQWMMFNQEPRHLSNQWFRMSLGIENHTTRASWWADTKLQGAWCQYEYKNAFSS